MAPVWRGRAGRRQRPESGVEPHSRRCPPRQLALSRRPAPQPLQGRSPLPHTHPDRTATGHRDIVITTSMCFSAGLPLPCIFPTPHMHSPTGLYTQTVLVPELADSGCHAPAGAGGVWLGGRWGSPAPRCTAPCGARPRRQRQPANRFAAPTASRALSGSLSVFVSSPLLGAFVSAEEQTGSGARRTIVSHIPPPQPRSTAHVTRRAGLVSVGLQSSTIVRPATKGIASVHILFLRITPQNALGQAETGGASPAADAASQETAGSIIGDQGQPWISEAVAIIQSKCGIRNSCDHHRHQQQEQRQEA